MATISDYTRILKEFYETGGLHDAINRELPLLSRFQRMVLDWTGRQAIFAVKVGRANSVGYLAEGATLPTANAQEQVQLTIQAKLLYGTFELSGPLLASAKNKVGSFVQALENEMDGAVDDVKNDAARALYVGGGVVGFITIRTAVVADTTEVEFFGNIEEIPVVAGGGGGLPAQCNLVRMDNYEIQNVAAAYNVASVGVYREAAGNMTVRFGQAFDFTAAALAAGGQDPLAFDIPLAVVLNNGAGNKPAIPQEPIGIYGNLASQNHWGINRNTSGANTPTVSVSGKEHLRACIRTNNLAATGAASNLSQARMEAILTELQEAPFAGKKTDLLVMRPTTRQAYVSLISNTSTLQTDTDKARHGDVGVGSISYNGITMMTDRHCGRGIILFLNTKSWKMAQLKAADIEDLDGNVLSRLENTDAFRGYVSWYYNTVCIMPNCNGALVGFDFPGLP